MSKEKNVGKIFKEETVPVKPEEEAVEAPSSEELTSDEEVAVIEELAPVGGEVIEELESEEAPEEKPEEPVVEVKPPFKNMPGKPKKPKGITVKKRVPKLKDNVLKLYKRMKLGERLTEEEFAKRLKLKDPMDIQAAGIAWHHLFDEGVVPDTQFYKPVLRTNR